jgi:colicin import membrane protein
MSEPEKEVKEQQADPFWLGRRYLKEVGPDGEETYREVPLREEDLLFPQEGDRLVLTESHTRNCIYAKSILEIVMGDRPDAMVFMDHRIDFGVEGMEPLGPDVAVFVDLNGVWDVRKGTFGVAEFGARPLLVIEVTSPDTRRNDLGPKVDLYFEAKVPYYAVVDLGPKNDWSPVVLRGYRAAPGGYSPVQPDEKGRLWLSTLGLWLVPEGEKVFLCTADGERLPEWRETHAANKKAGVRIEELETLSEEAILARQEAERETVTEGRKRADAEKLASEESRKRADAEKLVSEETRKRADAESRAAELTALVAQLQAQLRQSGGQV